jgi:hypothetical protein
VSSAVWRKVPSGPVKVPSVSGLSSLVILFEVVPAVVSAIRMSRSASQQRMTWARILRGELARWA